MKYFIYLLIVIAFGLIVYNATFLNFDNFLEGDSKTALISIFASACVIIALLILIVSRAIHKKSRRK